MAATAPRAPLVAAPLAPRARAQLLAAGYATAGDLEGLTPETLAAGALARRAGAGRWAVGGGRAMRRGTRPREAACCARRPPPRAPPHARAGPPARARAR